MTTWNGNATNEDGLVVRFSTDRSTVVTDGVSNGQAVKMFELTIDSQNLPGIANGGREDIAHLPAGAMITDAKLIATTAFTGTGTLTVGFAKSDGTALDADGVDAAVDVDSVLGSANDAVTCDGVLVDGTEALSERAWVYATTSGTVSAGVAKLRILYIEG
jgi:hypothetical protein